MPPHTTKRRPITNLKAEHNKNCQKIQLYGTLTTKELKKKHSFRLVGGAEPGQRGHAARKLLDDGTVKAVAGRPGILTFACR